MNKDKIIYQDEINQKHKEIIIEGLNKNAYKQRVIGRDNASFSFVIEDDNGCFKAGMSGFNYYGCFHIDLLFVAENFRGHGYGAALMQQAEDLARERRCLFMSVNTMDFEARPFYEKQGFKLEFTRTGFEKGVKMYFLQKDLAINIESF
jgi:GNAT superfamily N-acetyltransferase